MMRRTDSLEKILMLGKIEGRRRGDDRGWDSWMASLTQWTWVWISSGSWWSTGKPGMLRFMGSQRVRHSWATELNWGPWNLLLGMGKKECSSLSSFFGLFLVDLSKLSWWEFKKENLKKRTSWFCLFCILSCSQDKLREEGRLRFVFFFFNC